MKGYYATGKRGSLDGVPIWRPKWYGELGNDAEAMEATKPRTTFKRAYYNGGYRLIIDGTPVRVAAYVQSWRPWMRRALGKGTERASLSHPYSRLDRPCTQRCEACESRYQMARLLGMKAVKP